MKLDFGGNVRALNSRANVVLRSKIAFLYNPRLLCVSSWQGVKNHTCTLFLDKHEEKATQEKKTRSSE